MIDVARTFSYRIESLSFSTPMRRSEAMTPRSDSTTSGTKARPCIRSASMAIIVSRAAGGNQSV